MTVLKRIAQAAVLLAAAAPARAAVFAEPTVGYSGAVTVLKDGRKSLTTKVYYERHRLRMDLDVGRNRTAAIAHQKSRIGYFVIFNRRECLVGRLDAPMAYRITFARRGTRVRRLGAARVNGYRATKYRVRGRTDAGDHFDGFVWRTRHNIVVRMAGTWRRKGGTVRYVMNLANLRIGRQSPHAFTVPVGFRRVRR